jgi:hypothetical protein
MHVFFLKTNYCFIFECILELSLYGLKPLNFPHIYSKNWVNLKRIEEYCKGKPFLCAFSRIKWRQSRDNITFICDSIISTLACAAGGICWHDSCPRIAPATQAISTLAWLTRSDHLPNSHWSSYFRRWVTEVERPMRSQPTITPCIK